MAEKYYWERSHLQPLARLKCEGCDNEATGRFLPHEATSVLGLEKSKVFWLCDECKERAAAEVH